MSDSSDRCVISITLPNNLSYNKIQRKVIDNKKNIILRKFIVFGKLSLSLQRLWESLRPITEKLRGEFYYLPFKSIKSKYIKRVDWGTTALSLRVLIDSISSDANR